MPESLQTTVDCEGRTVHLGDIVYLTTNHHDNNRQLYANMPAIVRFIQPVEYYERFPVGLEFFFNMADGHDLETHRTNRGWWVSSSDITRLNPKADSCWFCGSTETELVPEQDRFGNRLCTTHLPFLRSEQRPLTVSVINICPTCGGYSVISCFICHPEEEEAEPEEDNSWDAEDSDSSRDLTPHGYKPRLFFQPGDGLPLYYGLELETDNFDSVTQAIEDLNNLDNTGLFWLTEDSSLEDGIEIVTHPCTLDFHRQEFPWGKIIRTVKDNGGSSHNTITCGLHIHFSRTILLDKELSEDVALIKFLYLTEKFWPELVKFSRRSTRQLHQWAHRYSTQTDGGKVEKLGRIKDEAHHYAAINIENYNTIEVRIFRGSLNEETIFAAIELVDLMIHIATNWSLTGIHRLSWKFFTKQAKEKKYPNLHKYLIRKGLKEDKNNVPNHSEAPED